MNPFEKFEQKLKSITEDNSAGAGGAFGTPQETPNMTSGDTYARGDARNVFGGKLTKKKKKKTPIIRRSKIEKIAL